MFLRFFVALTTALACLCAMAQTISEADTKAYGECEQAAQAKDSAKAIEACLAPAKAGIPGAQYALGALLINRNGEGDRTAGIEWLEKSVASGNPAASFLLGGVLLADSAPASQSRARELLKAAICAGYPMALDVLKKQGVGVEQIGCAHAPNEDFSGEWIADLQWVKAGITLLDDKHFQFKIVVSPDSVHVFTRRKANAADWLEVKPGKFKIEKLQRSAILSVLDSGWDFEGEWIESWSLALLLVGTDEARVVYTRTVNNLHVPKNITWSSFSTYAEGTAHRGH